LNNTENITYSHVVSVNAGSFSALTISSGLINSVQTASAIGAIGGFFALFLYLPAVMAGLWQPVVALSLFGVVFTYLYFMNLITVGAGTVSAIIFGTLVLIWWMRR